MQDDTCLFLLNVLLAGCIPCLVSASFCPIKIIVWVDFPNFWQLHPRYLATNPLFLSNPHNSPCLFYGGFPYAKGASRREPSQLESSKTLRKKVRYVKKISTLRLFDLFFLVFFEFLNPPKRRAFRLDFRLASHNPSPTRPSPSSSTFQVIRSIMEASRSHTVVLFELLLWSVCGAQKS